jgi:DNA-binding transcriptional ArsR family regulator
VPAFDPTTDVFEAIAEPRRRAIIQLLASEGEQGVGAIVSAIGSPQPAVSKQLAVLRDAGVVAVRRRGRERLYRLEAEGLRSVYEWAGMFERLWTHKADRIARRAEATHRRSAAQPRSQQQSKEEQTG